MADDKEMKVIKRSGSHEEVSFDKILNRVKNLGNKANLNIKYAQLVMKVIDQLYDNIDTSRIDELTAEQCASMSTSNPDYGSLASLIVISNLHKNSDPSFYNSMKKLYEFRDIHGKHSPIIAENIMKIIEDNKNYLDSIIDFERDNNIDYFGFKTLERAYLLKVNGVIVERPQHMWLRVSIGIHGNNLSAIKETYDLMSQKYFTHATPTLYNSGTPRPQLSSCYLIAMESDSIDGIYNTLKDCAKISKWAGGIGLHIHNIRSSGSHIRGTNGTSNGIVPMLGVFNKTARYVDQCVVPETYIYTVDGPKKIQDVTTSDYIFNESGFTEKISNVLEHPYVGKLYSIETEYCFDPLVITDEHPIFVLRNTKRNLNHSSIENRLDKDYLYHSEDPNKMLVWKDVKDLRTDDMLAFAIPKYEKKVDNITFLDCYMYGLIIAYGNMKNNDIVSYLKLETHNHKDIIYFCKLYFENKCVEYEIVEEGEISYVRWNRSISLPFRYSDVYNSNNEKHISSKWLNMPLVFASNIIKGLINMENSKNKVFKKYSRTGEPGGNIDNKDMELVDDVLDKQAGNDVDKKSEKETDNDTENIVDKQGKSLVFNSTSRTLIEEIRYLLLRMEILTTCSSYKIDNKYSNSNTLIYEVNIPITKVICKLFNVKVSPSQCVKFFSYKNYIFTKIKSITLNNEDYHGVLYDLQMRNIHSYMIHNGIIHNGGGKRNGSFAIYIEPHHGDIEAFLDLKKNHGDEELRSRDLFYAVWVSDLFMERVRDNDVWSLFCPDACPDLSKIYGDEFKKRYLEYENDKKYIKQVRARDIWVKILESQMETGTPYILYKDACNKKSNQKNIGTIMSSNLCTEILEYSDDKETAVCNLASVAVNKFVRNDKTFDYDKLHDVIKIITSNLNNIIDVNFYPTEKTRRSNLLHRPIGIGIQGLADAFILMDLPYESNEAKEINKNIFETMYHASLERSNEISRDRQLAILSLHAMYTNKEWDFESNDDTCNTYINIKNNNVKELLEKYKPIRKELYRSCLDKLGAYSSFEGCPAEQGILQFDMWDVKPSDRYNWQELKNRIKLHGIRNSLLLAPMPTASTSQILGNNECFEPFTSNIYTRRTLAGEFVLINKHLMNELINLGLWSNEIKNNIIANKGSVQYIKDLPQNIKDKYKIVWEMSMKNLIDMSRDRGAFICQSQSLNLWMEDPDTKALTNMHFYSWKAGLKTGIYYLRRKAKHQPQQFTIEPEKKTNNDENDGDDEPCEMCSG